MENRADKSIIIWLLSGCFLIYAMVVIGAITRLTQSGLSMVEWNMLLGSLPPSSENEWMALFEKYQASPEFQLINSHFSVEDFKSIYWWEYIHRLLGRTIGVVFIVPFLFFFIKKKFDKVLLKKMMVLLFLGAFQGVLGWFMVKSGLQKEPHVSHYRLAAHLISAFTVFGFTFWYALDLVYPKRVVGNTSTKNLRGITNVMFSIVIVQIVYGAFVAGLKAGLFYNSFPLMGDTFMPDTVVSYDPFWKNMLENPSGVQFIHRTLAYCVFIAVLYVWEAARKANLSFMQRRASNVMLLVVIIQFVLGVITLIYSVPVVMGVLHQTGAFVLFASILFFKHSLKNNS